MDSAHEALKLHVMDLARPIGTRVASLKSVTESENTRPRPAHPPEKTDELGRTKRSTTKAGLAGQQTLGIFFFQNAVTGFASDLRYHCRHGVDFNRRPKRSNSRPSFGTGFLRWEREQREFRVPGEWFCFWLQGR